MVMLMCKQELIIVEGPSTIINSWCKDGGTVASSRSLYVVCRLGIQRLQVYVAADLHCQ